jgi:proteasome lid subunit RPN8/RPN11
VIDVNDWLREELIRRAEAEDPEECCGLISRTRKGLALWGATNVAKDPTAGFEIAPGSLLAIITEIGNQGQELVGVYHSHPHGPVTPSTEDILLAGNWPGLTWVIAGRSVCGGCKGEGEVAGPRAEGAPAAATVKCDGCDGAGTVPDVWAGVLA